MIATSAAAEWLPDLPTDVGDSKSSKDSWRENLMMNNQGNARAVLANAITALRLAPEWDGVLGFNEFSTSTVALKSPPWLTGSAETEWTDHEDRLTADWLQAEAYAC